MDEAVVRIVLQDDGGSAPATGHPAPPQSTTSQPQPAAPNQSTPPPPPPAPSTAATTRAAQVDAKTIEAYQNIARAVNLARQNSDAFAKSMEGVQGQLFKLRTGVDPQAIADVFSKGGAAAADLLKKLTEINTLVGRGAISQSDRLQLVRGEIGAAATTAAATATITKTTGGEPDWIKHLVEGIEGSNRHVLIEGQSGSGKSLLTKHIAFERMRRGEEVHVVDPHTPEAWGGAKQVFQGKDAAAEAAKFLRETLEGRKQERIDARARGEEVDFKPLTIVMSDFARMIKDSPKLAEEFRTILTEARKFRISVVADTTALTGAATGVKGIQDVRQNFAQQVKLHAPTAATPVRTAEVGGKTYETPLLPDYKERTDPSLIRPTAPEPPPPAEMAAVEETESYLDRIVKIASNFRGVIGGFAGSLVGAGLDALAMIQRAQVGASRRRGQQATSASPSLPPTTPIPAGAPPSTAAAAGGVPEAAVATAAPVAAGGATAAAAGTSAAGGAAASGAAAATAVAGPLIIAGIAVAAFAKVVSIVSNEMARTADHLSQYNATIAGATARAEVRQTLGDIRRAEQAAPVLSRFTDARSQLADKAEDLKIKFMEAVGPTITEILNVANMAVQVLTAILNGVIQVVGFVAALPLIKEILDILNTAWTWIKARFGITSDETPGEDPVNVIMNGLFANLTF